MRGAGGFFYRGKVFCCFWQRMSPTRCFLPDQQYCSWPKLLYCEILEIQVMGIDQNTEVTVTPLPRYSNAAWALIRRHGSAIIAPLSWRYHGAAVRLSWRFHETVVALSWHCHGVTVASVFWSMPRVITTRARKWTFLEFQNSFLAFFSNPSEDWFSCSWG